MASFSFQQICPLLVFLLLLSSSPPSAFAGLCNKYDKKALLAIKAAFHDQYYFISWNDDLACCDWNALECDPDTGRVTKLYIEDDDELSGTIPDAVGDLPFLETLRIDKLPKLVGGIPQAIAKLKNLDFFAVSWTGVSGPVPSFLSQLPKLTYINLSFNKLSGSIPDTLGDLPLLEFLDISRNKLTGVLPPSLFQHMPKEAYLLLSHNNLSGEVPASYAKVPFVKIDVSRNLLTGDPSFLFGSWKQTQQIDLSRNSFEFNFSNVLFPEEHLNLMDVNHNKLFGSIPKQITNCQMLQFFNVSYNRLCGKIPRGGNMNRFDEYCYRHNDCLCGTPLPACKSIVSALKKI